MPDEVSKEEFLIITKTWYEVIVQSHDTLKADIAMGMVEKYIPDFLGWLGDHPSFNKIRHVSLHAFIETMKEISKLDEISLERVIKELDKHEGSS